MSAKIRTFFTFLLMVGAMSAQLQAQDCISCLEEPIDPVCVADDDGEIIPFPNACFAVCEGFSSDDFVDCDSTIFGGGNSGGSDCLDCLDEEFDPVCVTDAAGNILPFPNACFAECEGFTSGDFVDCDSTIFGGGHPGGSDCLDCLDEEFDPVCVEDADGNILPFPNACFAECEGFSSDDFVVCDSTIIGGGGTCDPDTTGGFDCIECLDEEFDPVCVEDSLGNILPFPNACFAECEGYTSDDFVDCDSTIFIGGGSDCIDCLDEEFDPVCVEDAGGNIIPFPNACFAECEGFTSDDFVVCDSIIIGGGGTCDPDTTGGFDCVECFDEEFIPVCVEDSLGNIIPFPNACFAECEGFTSDDFVICDSIIIGGGGTCDPDSIAGFDCEECLDEEFDPVCVADGNGEVFLFPNACFAECVGFTADDFVTCDPDTTGGGNDCFACIFEPIDPVCVLSADSSIIEYPNLCFAECEGYTTDDLVDCDDFTGGGNNGSNLIIDVDAMEQERTAGSLLNIVQNPVNERLKINYTSTDEEVKEAILTVIDLNGKELLKQSVSILGSSNYFEMDATSLQPGIYLLSLKSAAGLQTVKFIK